MKGLRLGAIDLIQKPFSFEILDQKIETILKNINKQKRAILTASISNLKSLNNLEPVHEEDNKSSKFDETCKIYNLTSRETEIVKFILKDLLIK